MAKGCAPTRIWPVASSGKYVGAAEHLPSTVAILDLMFDAVKRITGVSVRHTRSKKAFWRSDLLCLGFSLCT